MIESLFDVYEQEEYSEADDFRDTNDTIAGLKGTHDFYTRTGIMKTNPSYSSEYALQLATERQAKLTNEFRRTVVKYQVSLYNISECRQYAIDMFFRSLDLGEAVSKFSNKFNSSAKGVNSKLAEDLFYRFFAARESFSKRDVKTGVKHLVKADLSPNIFYSTEMLETLKNAHEDGDPNALKALDLSEEIKRYQEEMLSVCYAFLTKLTSERIHGILISKGLGNKESSSIQFCDLFQHGCEEILKATFRYDRKSYAKLNNRPRAAAWSNFAYSVANLQLNYFINENTRLVNVDRGVLLRANTVREALCYKGCDSYEHIAEIANKLLIKKAGKDIKDDRKFTSDEVERLLFTTQSGNPLSLSQTQDENDDNKEESFGDTLGDEHAITENIYELKNVMLKIRSKLKDTLTSDEFEILALRYYLDSDEGVLGLTKMPQDKVSIQYKMNHPGAKLHKNKIKIIEDRCIAKVRAAISKDQEWLELLNSSVDLELNPMFRNKIGILSMKNILEQEGGFYLTRKEIK